MNRRAQRYRQVLWGVSILLLVAMIVLIAEGARQFETVLVPLVAFPLFIALGAQRRSVRRRSSQ
ncbi:MAG: hypothetical protein ACP5PJ_03215 [Acidimicrobiales bacterium]